MTLLRTIVVLALWLVCLLVVVALHAETGRLHHEISKLEAESDTVRVQLREAELQLAREQNPMLIRRRVEEALRQLRKRNAPSDRGRSNARR